MYDVRFVVCVLGRIRPVVFLSSYGVWFWFELWASGPLYCLRLVLQGISALSWPMGRVFSQPEGLEGFVWF